MEKEMRYVCVYCNTADILTENDYGNYGMVYLRFPKDMLFDYFKEYELETFRGDDPDVSDYGLFVEWLDEYTCDDTLELYHYCKEKGYEPNKDEVQEGDYV